MNKITDNAKHMAWSDLMQQMLPFFFSAPLPPTSVSHVSPPYHPGSLALDMLQPSKSVGSFGL